MFLKYQLSPTRKYCENLTGVFSEPLVNPVNIERRGHIMLIMLNRPKDRNAVNQFMAEELYVAFKAFESDKSIKAGIICSSGDSFCSGYD